MVLVTLLYILSRIEVLRYQVGFISGAELDRWT